MFKSSILSMFGRGARDPAPAVAAEGPQPDSRRYPRVQTALAAVLQFGGESVPVNVGNLSPGGAMVDAERLPRPGAPVHLVRGTLCAPGFVIWSSSTRCGLRFPVEIEVDEWVAPAANGGQARIDEIVAQMKSGGAPLAADPSAAQHQQPESQRGIAGDLFVVCALLRALHADLSGSKLTLERHATSIPNFDQAIESLSDPGLLGLSRHQLAEELGAAFQLIVDLEDELTGSRETVARHGYKLQHLDLAMQMLSELAADLVIGGDGSNPRLENLRIACDKALQGAATDKAASRVA